ncbi:MAG: alpha/beta hydrolase [Chloroflexota bacterium]
MGTPPLKRRQNLFRKISGLPATLLVMELWRELFLPGNAAIGSLLLFGYGLFALFLLRDIFFIASPPTAFAPEAIPAAQQNIARMPRPKLASYLSNLFTFTNWMILLAFTAISCWLGHLTLHPARVPVQADRNPGKYGIPYQDIALTTSDGIVLQAWYTPPENGAVILVAHGFHNTRPAEIYALFARHGYGVLAWDFRGQGESGGDTVTLGYLEWQDVIAALDFARSQPKAERIGAWGNSMGGAAVLRAAAHRPDIRAVAIDSTYATMSELLNTNVSIPLMRWPMRWYVEWQTGLELDQARPVDWVGQISPRPVFLIGDPQDNMVGPGAIHSLYTAAGEPRQVWYTPGAGHNGMFQADPQAYEKRLIEFFAAAFPAGKVSQNDGEE